jgi:hypothetical protein
MCIQGLVHFSPLPPPPPRPGDCCTLSEISSPSHDLGSVSCSKPKVASAVVRVQDGKVHQGAF